MPQEDATRTPYTAQDPSTTIPLNQVAWWAVKRLLDRADKLVSNAAQHYLIPGRLTRKQYDPTKRPSRWGWSAAGRNLTKQAGLDGRPSPHDLRHQAITTLAQSPEASEQPSWQSPDT
jgi:integrase